MDYTISCGKSNLPPVIVIFTLFVAGNSKNRRLSLLPGSTGKLCVLNETFETAVAELQESKKSVKMVYSCHSF